MGVLELVRRQTDPIAIDDFTTLRDPVNAPDVARLMGGWPLAQQLAVVLEINATRREGSEPELYGASRVAVLGKLARGVAGTVQSGSKLLVTPILERATDTGANFRVSSPFNPQRERFSPAQWFSEASTTGGRAYHVREVTVDCDPSQLVGHGVADEFYLMAGTLAVNKLTGFEGEE